MDLVSFKTTTGDEFIKHVYRTIGKKTELKINFQKINLDKALESMEFGDEKPLLIYVHKNDHKLAQRILKTVLQDDEISGFIVSISPLQSFNHQQILISKNENFNPMGMLTSNREMKIIMNFIEKEAIPCFVILRKDKTSKICKLAQIELNCEGYLTKDVVMALLFETAETFQ